MRDPRKIFDTAETLPGQVSTHVPRALRPGRWRLRQALKIYLEANPDMRVGQALEAATSIIGQARGENLCVFYIEDDVLADGFDRLNGR